MYDFIRLTRLRLLEEDGPDDQVADGPSGDQEPPQEDGAAGDVVCPQCGHHNPDGSSYCNACGEDLRGDIDSPPVSPDEDPDGAPPADDASVDDDAPVGDVGSVDGSPGDELVDVDDLLADSEEDTDQVAADDEDPSSDRPGDDRPSEDDVKKLYDKLYTEGCAKYRDALGEDEDPEEDDEAEEANAYALEKMKEELGDDLGQECFDQATRDGDSSKMGESRTRRPSRRVNGEGSKR